MSEACRVLDTPVIGGNVSFYNETATDAVFPTPVVGMVGLIQNTDCITTQAFKDQGDIIVLLGENKEEIGGSEYLKVVHDMERGSVPQLDLESEKRLQDCCLELIESRMVKSAHDCSEGGMAVALAESCISGNIGASVGFESCFRKDFLLFGETQSRILVSVEKDRLDELKEIARRMGVPAMELGQVGGEKLEIAVAGKKEIGLDVAEMESNWRGAIKCIME